jgi:uncharacterized protein
VNLLQQIGSDAKEMPCLNLLQIIVGEFETAANRRLLFQTVINFLIKNEFISLFVSREDEGIGEKNDFRTYSFESIQFNNLPIKIELVGEEDRINEASSEVNNMIPHGQVSRQMVFGNPDQFPHDESLMLKLYMDEKSRWLKRPIYNEILLLLNEHNLIWSTVKRGIQGFGSDKSPKKNPIVIEVIGSASIIKHLIPKVKAKVPDGLVIVIPVEVIANK